MIDRIKQLMESQHLSQQNFAEKLQISPASLSSIFNARTKPTLNHVDAIVKSFPGISLSWLLYGQGSMFNDGGSTTQQPQSVAGGSMQADDMFLDFNNSTTPQQEYAAQHQMAGAGIPKMTEREVVKYIDKPQRKITEIRIYYDDHTWETFEMKK